MANRVFFSFHYPDVIHFRANVVPNHWLTKAHREALGFFDASIWETAKNQCAIALQRLNQWRARKYIEHLRADRNKPFARPWVRYELLKKLQARQRSFELMGDRIGYPNAEFHGKFLHL